jgi:hypothetical protein
MEADWSVALTAADPVIVVPWAASVDDAHRCKFVDLRQDGRLIDEIEEVRGRPALRSALLQLNGATSHLFTAKCDAWTSSPDQGDEPFDPYEMDATPGETAFGAGSYIDMLPRDVEVRGCFETQERWMRRVVQRLRVTAAKAAKVDMVLRHAEVEETPGFAMTWFVEACGATVQSAGQRWGEALELAIAAIMEVHFDTAQVDDTITETGE